jgi:hypothetical protein
MTVSYRILETRALAADVASAYVAATFAYLDRPEVELRLGVVLIRRDERWQIAQYQASPQQAE